MTQTVAILCPNCPQRPGQPLHLDVPGKAYCRACGLFAEFVRGKWLVRSTGAVRGGM